MKSGAVRCSTYKTAGVTAFSLLIILIIIIVGNLLKLLHTAKARARKAKNMNKCFGKIKDGKNVNSSVLETL